MQRSVSLAFDGDVVKVADTSVSRRGRMDPLDQVALLLLSLHGNGQVEAGKHRARARFDIVDQLAGRLDREHPAGGDARVPDQVRAGPSYADRPHLTHAVNASNRVPQLLLRAGRRAVDQDVAGAPSDQRRRTAHDGRHQQRGHRVGPAKAHPDPDQSGEHAQRCKHVREPVGGVGEHGFARSEPSHAPQHRGTACFDRERRDEERKGIARGVDERASCGEPAERFEGDERRRDQQQDPLGERCEVFSAAVAVGMLGVGRFTRRPDGDQGEPARGQVEERMRGLAQYAQAPGEQAHDELGHHQRHSDAHRAERDQLWTSLQPVHGSNVSAS